MTEPGSVVALMERNGLVCSVTRRHKPGNLSLVGGSIEPKDRHSDEETMEQVAWRAMVRETEEESGVLVVEAEKVFERVDETDGKVAWCYRVKEFEGEPRTMEPGVEVSWRKPAELLTSKCTFADYNRRLFAMLGLTSDGSCEKNKDGRHCVHWWDGDGPCCSCGSNAELDNE